MCGIAGLLGQPSRERVKAMADAIAHRRPDGSGIWCDAKAGMGLAHRRLEIIDLSDAASQPMAAVEGRYQVVFNGEIYNFKELAAGSHAKGYRFNSRPDTVILAPLYHAEGPAMFSRLNGIFAFEICGRPGTHAFHRPGSYRGETALLRAYSTGPGVCVRTQGSRHNPGLVCALAQTYGRYGYRRITALLGQAGWSVNAKRVQRIGRRERLKVPQKQPKRGRLWLNDGSCARLRAERSNHVWSYDFVEDRTHDGRKFSMLCVIDEFRREALAIRVKRRLNSTDVLETLADLMILRGPPAYVRSDNGPEFIAKTLREWIAAVGSQTAYIEPGSPWENVPVR